MSDHILLHYSKARIFALEVGISLVEKGKRLGKLSLYALLDHLEEEK